MELIPVEFKFHYGIFTKTLGCFSGKKWKNSNGKKHFFKIFFQMEKKFSMENPWKISNLCLNDL
jgi:hypothetical protein